MDGDPSQLLEDLWDLVWAGLVTNDSLAPVRAYTQSRGGQRAPGRRPLASSFPAHAGGRWSLLPLAEPDPTGAATTWANVLLNRYGVITRAHVAAEGIPGGYTRLYPVLSKMEEIGKVRRGYFIEGLGGTQFALPGAVDRLRGVERSQVLGLAATDPANPYGAALPWPVREVRFQRAAGSYVVGDILYRSGGNWNIAFYLSAGAFIVGAACWIFIDPVTSMDEQPVPRQPQMT